MVSAHLESTDVSSLFYSPGTERFSTVHCSLRKDLGKKKSPQVDGEIDHSTWNTILLNYFSSSFFFARKIIISFFISPYNSQEKKMLYFSLPSLLVSQ